MSVLRGNNLRKTLIISTLAIILLGSGTVFIMFYRKAGPVVKGQLITEVPITLERNNPVPLVKNWVENGRSVYYFNWGLKPTGGYVLELLEIRAKTIIIKAISPSPDEMVTQSITYPSLTVSLPLGKYHYQVVDHVGKPLAGIFRPQNPPLTFTLSLPSETGWESGLQRQIWRDPYLDNQGLSTAEIALKALFSQDELLEYADQGVSVARVTFSRERKKWYVLMSPEFNRLERGEQTLLSRSITETVLALQVKGLNAVELYTNPKLLSSLSN